MNSIKYTCLILSIGLTIVSCDKKKEDTQNNDFEVKHISHEEMKAATKLDIAVVNDVDPICGMNTKEHLGDTVTYKGKVYGFCSTMCKEEFLKDPKKHIHE